MKDKKITVSQYISEYFLPGSRPDRRTVISRIVREEIRGIREGRMYYVLVSANVGLTDFEPKGDLSRRASEFLSRQ